MGKLCKTTRNLFLIPLSYVTILGGICTLIGTSTNLVVHSMIQEAGMKGFSMFELGKVGIFIALAGIIYLFLFSKKLLPATRPETTNEEDGDSSLHLVEPLSVPDFQVSTRQSVSSISSAIMEPKSRNFAVADVPIPT